MDTTSLEQLTQPNSDITTKISDQIGGIFIFVTIASLIVTVVIVVFWLMAWLHRRKVQNAILDIQKTLHEMNERDKQRFQPAPLNAVQPNPAEASAVASGQPDA